MQRPVYITGFGQSQICVVLLWDIVEERAKRTEGLEHKVEGF